MNYEHSLKAKNVIEIKLTQGKVAIVDDIDSDLASFKWCFSSRGYAWRRNPDKRPAQLRIHRVILERILGRSLVKGEQVDHINMDRLDNRRENLRLATDAENRRNRGAQVNNKSGYKGVSWHSQRRKWVAFIQINNNQTYLGSFDTPEQAHEAYKQAAIKYHGEFARYD